MQIDYTVDCRATMVANIMDAWFAASPQDMTEGRSWYLTARQTAAQIGQGNVATGAGILAALSPRLPWDRNVKLAYAHAAGVPGGCLGNSSRKAMAIRDGADPRAVLTARKTSAFFDNIANAATSQAVTVDTHAYSIATRNDGASMTDKQYDAIADAYRRAAALLGEVPSVVQAVTWCWWRREGIKQEV